MRNAVIHVNATETRHTTIWLAGVDKSRSSLLFRGDLAVIIPHDVYLIKRIREKI